MLLRAMIAYEFNRDILSTFGIENNRFSPLARISEDWGQCILVYVKIQQISTITTTADLIHEHEVESTKKVGRVYLYFSSSNRSMQV